MSLTVLEPGPYTLVVDLGRPRHRSLGVPVGGTADRAALIQGNALVGNDVAAAALEFALAGPTLRAECDVGCVAFGAPFEVADGGRRVVAGHTFTLRAGDVLRIGTTPAGARGYLCVSGGLKTPEVLGSRSALEPVAKGQLLSCDGSTIMGRSLAEPLVSYALPFTAPTLRAIDGPQADWFDLDLFYGRVFPVTPASNRMGLRLGGLPLDRPRREMTSEPVCPGTVQVVNDGRCIVLGVDGQTIGGYPKIAQVIAADLDRLGQLHPGQAVTFERVTLEEAEVAWRERQRRLSAIVTRLQVASGGR
jgi:biotin-dependent carboxylase-like uncharacterized protein